MYTIFGFYKFKQLKKISKLKDKLQTDIDKLFHGNDKFAIAYVREGMSGERKFGNGPGTAEFCLVTDANGDNPAEHNILKDKSYLKKIAGRTKMNVRLRAFQQGKKKERQRRRATASATNPEIQGARDSQGTDPIRRCL